VVNKWDLMKPTPTGKMATYLQATFPSLDYVPFAFITAKSGKNVHSVLNLAQNMHKQASARVTTRELNKVLREALETSPPPMRQNRRPKVYYGTQVATNPPTIVLFTNSPDLFDNTYQRYLLKTMHDKLPFHDVPIKLYLRKRSREDTPPIEEPSRAVETSDAKPKKKKSRKIETDPSKLRFKTKVSENELKRGESPYESDLWKDL
jgi:GTP-binding protein